MKRIAVLHGYGINCNQETQLAFDLAIADLNLKNQVNVDQIHVTDLIRKEVSLGDFAMLTIPGGFLHGDDISAGKILASKMKTHLDAELKTFINQGKLVLGICNGFQVLLKYPLLPDVNDSQRYTLTENKTGRFIDRWVTVKVNKDACPVYLRGIHQLRLPIRHAEGRFVASKDHLEDLHNNDQVGMQYADHHGDLAEGEFPLNPNGSELDIAGICDNTGRILGLMPHPEAFVHPLQDPDWLMKRRSGEINYENNGLRLFKNAVNFLVTENIG